VPSLAIADCPRTEEPARKVTIPVGVPAPGATAETVAVKVTLAPTALGLAEAASDNEVLALPTVTSTPASSVA